MLKKISVASLMMAMLVVCLVLTTSANAQRRKARGRAPAPAVTVLDNEAKLTVKSQPKGVTVTDNEARLNRGRGRARTSRVTTQKPVSAAIDNTVADGPVRVKSNTPTVRQGQGNVKEPTSVEIPNLVKAKKPGHFIGGTDDGQSIRQKQPHRRRGRH